MLRSSTTSYYDLEGLGSVTSLSNSAGSLVQTYSYDSFGRQTSSSGSLTNPFQYTAREFDPETSLYYYRARYYDPTAGRFVSEDPLQSNGGNNFYEYAYNDPSNWVDPDGLQAQLKYVDPPPQLTVIEGGAAEGAGAASGVGAVVFAVGLIVADVGLLGYDVYKGLDLMAAYGLITPKDPGMVTANTIAHANQRAARQCAKRNKNCPDCVPPAGTIVYDVNTDHAHFPFVGRHWHLLVMSQNPMNCKCSWQRVGPGTGPPPPNAQPMDPKILW
jgi:RHS repeat-associated protein